jgi:phage major head subunit gpT-like protein
VPLADFRTNHRTRMGGYGNLPTVAEGAAYTALTSPADEEATYAPTKRGGTEDITLEMIRNDDVGAIRRVPLALARAAAQTLHEFVFDFLRTNPTIYDGVALFHATHGNLSTGAFSAAEYMVGRGFMRVQTAAGSGKRIGLLPRYLIIPIDLDEAAYNAFRQDTNIEPRQVATEQVRPTIITVPYWTDANNWYQMASPMDTPTIEIGFLDGREEPEIFVQDSPDVGSMFTNDKRTYKIRHVYGGAVLEYRGFQGHIVA